MQDQSPYNSSRTPDLADKMTMLNLDAIGYHGSSMQSTMEPADPCTNLQRMSDRQNAKLAQVLAQSMEQHHLDIKDIERAMPCCASVFDAAMPTANAHDPNYGAQTESHCSPMATFENHVADPHVTHELVVVGQSKLVSEIQFADAIPEKDRRLIHKTYIQGAQGEVIDADEKKWTEEILIENQ